MPHTAHSMHSESGENDEQNDEYGVRPVLPFSQPMHVTSIAVWAPTRANASYRGRPLDRVSNVSPSPTRHVIERQPSHIEEASATSQKPGRAVSEIRLLRTVFAHLRLQTA